ncbi:unnamed protein product [Rhizoctonia solani]|uniref:DUF7587 domain-containing protein n=1 Tax=Rhizoctonia solani TaxID=456999 RepID=A0A8H2XZC5_9AGAM|nr:unnamed protein product [Rhizoctonia solani]
MSKIKGKLLSGIFDRKKASKEELDSLMSQTRFLYRVFTSDCRSPRISQGFVAHKYRNNVDMIDVAQLLVDDNTRDVSGLSHIENQENSPWISTTRAWDWAMWKLMSPNEKMAGARVAVIDLLHFPELQLQTPGAANRQLPSERFHGQIIHALEAINRAELQDSSAKSLNAKTVQRARDRANSADEVLVYAVIPSSAIVSTFNLQDIMPSIPPHFTPSPSAESEKQKKKRGSKDEDEDHKLQIGLFRKTRHRWRTELEKEKWDTDKHGRKNTQLAHAFLKERSTQITQKFSQLNNLFQPAIDHGVSSTTDATSTASDHGQAVEGTEDDDCESHESSGLADMLGRVGIYEIEAELGSLISLASAVSRLSTSSREWSSQESLATPVPETTNISIDPAALLANLSMLSKSYHISKQGPGPLDANNIAVDTVGAPEEAKNDPNLVEMQRLINIFCDQLLILASSILEPYWDIKERQMKDWGTLKHAIAELGKLKVAEMEEFSRRFGVDEIAPSEIFEKFEKGYPPYRWVTNKPMSKRRRMLKTLKIKGH